MVDVEADQILRQAYDTGALAFESDGRNAVNPYDAESEEAKYWDHGFRDAQKASEMGH